MAKDSFEYVGRYEELRLRLNSLNQQLTESGAEIETAPELSKLDEEAFQSHKPGISIRQILSLTGQSVDIGEEKDIALDNENPITSNAAAFESKYLITVPADLSPSQIEVETDRIDTSADAESKSKNAVSTVPGGDHDHKRLRSHEVAVQSVTTTESSQQMCFDWT